jgi:hypothetical protein
MPTLMEALKGQLASVDAPGKTDETDSLRSLMAAKSGRALTPGSSPRASSLGESSAVGQARDQAGALAAQGAAAAAEVGAADAAQQAKADAQSTQIDLQREKQKSQFKTEADRLAQDFANGQKQLGVDRDQAAAEQLSFLTTLQNDQFITQLEQAGAERRLNEEISFNEALAEDVFAAERDLLKEKLKFSDILNMDDNAWQRELGMMNLEFAMEMSKFNANAANTAAQYTALGNIVGAGAKGAADYKTAKKNEAPEPDE